MAKLDVESVGAFVLVADLGSFTRAAHALDTSQAAISVKVKRLEDRLGYRLLERNSRKVSLSAQGSTFLVPARNFIKAHELALAGLASEPRRLVVGISDQVAGPGLPALLANLAMHDPALIMEIHIDASRKLMDALDNGTLSAAIVRGEDDRRDGVQLVRERLGWFAASAWKRDRAQPVRLASLAVSCGVRTLATQLLDEACIPWTEVFVGGGIAAVGAAVSAGLAIAAMPYGVAPSGSRDIGQEAGLPRLPFSAVMLHSSVTDPSSTAVLRALAAFYRTAETPR